MQELIHIAAIGMHNVHFFRSPLDGPRQPWVAVDDLLSAITLPRRTRRMIKGDLLKGNIGENTICSIATSAGRVDIVPHAVAQGVIGFAEECHGLGKDFEQTYVKATVAALDVITAGMTEHDQLHYVIAAYRNENGIEGDFVLKTVGKL